MSSFQNSESIKQVLYEELQNILSHDSNVRTSAEERLSQLKFTEGEWFLNLPELCMLPAFPTHHVTTLFQDTASTYRRSP